MFQPTGNPDATVTIVRDEEFARRWREAMTGLQKLEIATIRDAAQRLVKGNPSGEPPEQPFVIRRGGMAYPDFKKACECAVQTLSAGELQILIEESNDFLGSKQGGLGVLGAYGRTAVVARSEEPPHQRKK